MIVIITILVYFNFKSDSEERINFDKDRIFKLKLEEFNCFELKSPTRFVTSSNGIIQFLNPVNQKLYLMSYTGNLIDSLGGGRGEAPLENKRMSSFTICPTHYFTFDRAKQSINKVSRNNELKLYFTDSLSLIHAIWLKKNEFLFSSKNAQMQLFFGRLDIESGKANKTANANIFPDEEYNFLIYDGIFAKNKLNEIIYTTKYSNDILKFDKNGDLDYHVKLIHETPLIQLKREGGLIIPTKNNNPSISDVELDSKYIYVLSNVSNKSNLFQKNKKIMDIYYLKNGDYYTSSVLPDYRETPPMDIAVGNDKLVLVYETRICVYETHFE